MQKVPDIQDAGDVTRFARNCYYPKQRDAEGNVLSMYYIRDAAASGVLAHVFDGEDPNAHSAILSFDEFLTLEQGYYKSRFVEYGGSIVYVRNNGADEHHRNHSFKVNATRYHHFHPDITGQLEASLPHDIARYCLSVKRTRYSEALDKLAAGEGVGYALSDNFGLITTGRSDKVQIVRRTKVVGEVHEGVPRMYPGFDHYSFAVQKLWR